MSATRKDSDGDSDEITSAFLRNMKISDANVHPYSKTKEENVHPYSCIKEGMTENMIKVEDLIDSMKDTTRYNCPEEFFECEKYGSILNHPWGRYYSDCSASKKTRQQFDADRFINDYCIHRAEMFRNVTIEWLLDPFKSTLESIVRKKTTKMLIGYQEEIPLMPYAIYRVVEKYRETGYVLTPVHREVYGGNRVDLREIILDKKAVNIGSIDEEWFDKLFFGDLLYVFRISTTGPNAQKIFNTLTQNIKYKEDDKINYVFNDDFKPIWTVNMFALLPRTIKNNVTVTPIAFEGRSTVILAEFGSSIPLKTSRNMYPETPLIDDIYAAKVFIPVEIVDRFVNGFEDSSADHALHVIASKIIPYSSAPAKVLGVQKGNTQKLSYFKNGHIAFSHFSGDEIMKAVYFSNALSTSILATAHNSYSDRQIYRAAYEIENNRQGEDTILKFAISNPHAPPSQISWKQGVNIEMIFTFGRIQGSIQSTILDDDRIQIVARLPKFFVQPHRADIEKQYNKASALISQRDEEIDAVLNSYVQGEDQFKNMKSNSNGYKILSALFGGKTIRQEVNEAERPYHVIQKNNNFYMNEYQSSYIKLLSENIPALIANSPFGSGKTTMMSVATNILCEDKSSVHLMVTVTNSAAVNLIEACDKNRSISEYNILRIITKNRYNTIEDAFQTEFDAPILMRRILFNFVEENDEVMNLNENDEIMRHKYETALLFCLEQQIISVRTNQIHSEFGQKICEQFVKNNKRTTDAIDVFCSIYKPRRIVCTLATSLSAFKKNWECLYDKIGTIQVDEASQLTQTALVALIGVFSKCRFTLVGDYHQLSPFLPQFTSPIAKTYADGRTLERCHKDSLITSITLRYVYRAHPFITKLLSETFYNGMLLTNIHPSERSTCHQLIWWPNKLFPIMFIHSDSRFCQAGTSMYNVEEMEVVDTLIREFSLRFGDESVGVAAFYKAQTNRLKNQHKGILIETVDAFQGRERNIIIVCSTKTQGQLSDFVLDVHRVNVALSRARDVIIIIGNLETMSSSSVWSSITQKVARHGNIMMAHQFRQIHQPYSIDQ